MLIAVESQYPVIVHEIEDVCVNIPEATFKFQIDLIVEPDAKTINGILLLIWQARGKFDVPCF